MQVHTQHRCLPSSSLPPHTNRRTNAWGGSPEKLVRLLLDVLRAVRRGVGPGFQLAAKINFDDFRKGGFTHDE